MQDLQDVEAGIFIEVAIAIEVEVKIIDTID